MGLLTAPRGPFPLEPGFALITKKKGSGILRNMNDQGTLAYPNFCYFPILTTYTENYIEGRGKPG